MNILRSYKRTRLFLWVNITGLAIGLAASIILAGIPVLLIIILTVSWQSWRTATVNPVDSLKNE
jgi:dolichyl-phosphate-mannose--protein O-mannosyl transferase